MADYLPGAKTNIWRKKGQAADYYCHKELGVQTIITTLRSALSETAQKIELCHMWETHSRLAAGCFTSCTLLSHPARTGFKLYQWSRSHLISCFKNVKCEFALNEVCQNDQQHPKILSVLRGLTPDYISELISLFSDLSDSYNQFPVKILHSQLKYVRINSFPSLLTDQNS